MEQSHAVRSTGVPETFRKSQVSRDLDASDQRVRPERVSDS